MWMCRCGTLWLTRLLIATKEPSLCMACCTMPASHLALPNKGATRSSCRSVSVSKCALGISRQWPGNKGRLSRKTRVRSSSKTTAASSSPATMLQNRQSMVTMLARLRRPSIRPNHSRRDPSGIFEPLRRGGNHDRKAALIEGLFGRATGFGSHQRQIFQDGINVSFFRQAKVEILRAKMNAHGLIRQPPGQERAAIHGVFEPFLEAGGGIQIEKQLDGLFLVASEFAHLQIARVRGSFPVHVPRALESFVGADAIEVPPQPAVMSLDLSREIGQQLLETSLCIDARINNGFPAQDHARGLFEKSEWKPGMERKVILAVFAAPRKTNLHGFLERRSAWNDGKVYRQLQHRRDVLFHPHYVDGKRRHPKLHVAHEELRRYGAPRRHMLGNQEIQFQSGQAQAAHESRNQQRGKHGGKDQEEQVIGGGYRREAHQHDGHGKQHAAARDFVSCSPQQHVPHLKPTRAHV